MKRNSSVELLRIFCIIGIIIMHILGPVRSYSNSFNSIAILICNTIFNTGVSIFVLISGFYGIKFNLKRLFGIWIQVLVCSILSFFIISIFNSGFNYADLIKSLVPIITNKYWFITCYLMLYIFSPYLNKFTESISKKDYKSLLVILFIILSVIPTFKKMGILSADGKDFYYFIFLYLIGRYISLYDDIISHNISCLTISSFITFILMFIIFNIKNELVLGYFFRDNSIFILLSSISIFNIFKQRTYYSKIINFLSSGILSVYMLEYYFRIFIFEKYFYNVINLSKSFCLIPYVFVYSFLVFVIITLFEIVRKKLFYKLEENVYLIMMKVYYKVMKK